MCMKKKAKMEQPGTSEHRIRSFTNEILFFSAAILARRRMLALQTQNAKEREIRASPPAVLKEHLIGSL